MPETAVWFDLDGTLVTYERDFDRLVEDALVAAGVRSPPDGAYEAFAEHVFSAIEACEPEPVVLAYEAVARDLGLDVGPEAAASAHVELEVEASVPTEGSLEAVEAVAERAPVGVLSNGDGDLQRAKLAAHGFDEVVDAVVISEEVGAVKPDPAIFEAAEDELAADRHVFVGDEYESDVQPATDVGWEAIHVRNDEGPSVSLDRLGSLRALLL